MVKEWVRGDHITFEANPNFWGEASKAQTLIFRWSAEAAQRLVELQSGTVDGIFLPSADDYETISADPNLALYPFETGNIFYIGMNNTIAPFDNDKVRQAVAMAINKQQIVDNYYPAGSAVAEQFVPPSFKPGFSTSGDGAKWYAYDPDAAKALLAEAGFPNGFETTISYRDVVRVYLPNVNQVVQEIQAQLAEVGIKVTIEKIESGPFLDSVAAGEQGLYLLGWGMDYPDATNFYDYHFASNQVRFGNEWPDLVAEIKAAAQLGDPAERQVHYDEANRLIKEHVPVIPVAHGTTANAMKADVGNVVMGPLNENFEQMTTPSGQLVWVQSAEPTALSCADESRFMTHCSATSLAEWHRSRLWLPPGNQTPMQPNGHSPCVKALPSITARPLMRMMWSQPMPPNGMLRTRTTWAEPVRLNTSTVSLASSSTHLNNPFVI
jgi:ABC-type transport system substrate-binding protein